MTVVVANGDDGQQGQGGALDIYNHKWIFVGGKGGVGKTSVSSSIAHLLTNKFPNEKILLISTDPAHNLSDIFVDNFSHVPKKARGKDNLYVIEIDPSSDKELDSTMHSEESSLSSIKKMLKHLTGEEDALSLLPGIDETTAIIQVLEYANSSQFTRLVFDTAPTGHTLRLLHLPLILAKTLSKISQWLSGSGSQMIQQVGNMLTPDFADKMTELSAKVCELSQKMDKLVSILKDPEQSQFTCVAIAEYLSIYENERLIQKLSEDEIAPVRNFVVNRIDLDENGTKKGCKECSEKHGKHIENLKVIEELFEEYHPVYLPVQNYDIRGIENIDRFSKLLTSSSYTNKVRDLIQKSSE